MDTKEDRIRALTRLYYSNPAIQKLLLEFARDREVIPRYFEGFGKRPDTLQYPSDIMGLVNKGATSFHASEELWHNPLAIASEMRPETVNQLRKGWDLLLDIDSPFLDCSKIAAQLLIAALEHHGVTQYGIKFSGSKGFHIIVPASSFPKHYEGSSMHEMFPAWPRAISEYLMQYIRSAYYRKVGEILSARDIMKRTNLSEAELVPVYCTAFHHTASKGSLMKYICPVCSLNIERRDVKPSARKLRCLKANCPGVLELIDTKEYHYCPTCKDPANEKMPLASDKYPGQFEEVRGVNAERVAKLDLVLVAPRHLFRMPYSLHEKTALASIVLTKSELDSFNPLDADPLKVVIKPFLPSSSRDEATGLLSAALRYKQTTERQAEKVTKEAGERTFQAVDLSGVTEDMYPPAIKKLLKGLEDGRKRGLFILITFFRSLNFPQAYVEQQIALWNEKNQPPLKSGYIRTQIDWHFKQSRKILPPNYDNESFYKDLGLIDRLPTTKNPLVDVLKNFRRTQT